MHWKANWRLWRSLRRIERQNRAKSKQIVYGTSDIYMKLYKVQKAKFSAKYHKEHDYAINRVKAIKRANDSKNVKRSTLAKYNIKWNKKYTEVPLNWQDAPLTI